MGSWTDAVIRYKNAKNPGSSANLKQVTIGVTGDVEEILTKMLPANITYPTTSSSWEGGKKETKILDLLRVEERFTVTGHLVTGHSATTTADVDGEGNETYTEQSNASDKRDDLKEIFLAGGTFWMTWQDTTIECNSDKLQINIDNMEGVEPSDGEIGYKVTITLIKGVDLQ